MIDVLYFAWVRERIGLPRERVERLLDPATPFLEIGALAAELMGELLRWREAVARSRRWSP